MESHFELVRGFSNVQSQNSYFLQLPCLNMLKLRLSLMVSSSCQQYLFPEFITPKYILFHVS
jgi:hypothetical protein